jgi:hypothetical protein
VVAPVLLGNVIDTPLTGKAVELWELLFDLISKSIKMMNIPAQKITYHIVSHTEFYQCLSLPLCVEIEASARQHIAHTSLVTDKPIIGKNRE